MPQTIQLIKPNLHLVDSIDTLKSGQEVSQEVLFSCNTEEDLMKASRHIDTVAKQVGKTLNVVEWELKSTRRQVTTNDQYEEKYTAPLIEFLDAIAEYGKGKFHYIRPRDVPFGHKIYAYSESTLVENSRDIREKLKYLETYLSRVKEEQGVIAIFDSTKALLESKLREIPSTVAFHVDVGVNNQGFFPVGRVSIYPTEKDAKSVADLAVSVVTGLKQFGGPSLSNDASTYLHQSDWMRRNLRYVVENDAFLEPHEGYRERLLAL